MADSHPTGDEATKAAVDAVIVALGGDQRAAIRALLHDIEPLARDYSASVSRRFIRTEKVVWLGTIGTIRDAVRYSTKLARPQDNRMGALLRSVAPVAEDGYTD